MRRRLKLSFAFYVRLLDWEIYRLLVCVDCLNSLDSG